MSKIRTADISLSGTLQYWNGTEVLDITLETELVPQPILDQIARVVSELEGSGFARRHAEIGEGRAFTHDVIGNAVKVRESHVDPILEICDLHAPAYWAARAAQIAAIEVPTRPEEASL